MTITLDSIALDARPGDTVTFRGYLTNLDNAQLDLIGCSATIPGLFTADCTPFLVNAPLFLNPNEVTPSFDLFTVTLPSLFTDPLGPYAGVFNVDGGIDVGGSSSDDIIGQVSFAVNVVPEPASWYLLGTVVALGVGHRRLCRPKR
jgi:hypothetical protein